MAPAACILCNGREEWRVDCPLCDGLGHTGEEEEEDEPAEEPTEWERDWCFSDLQANERAADEGAADAAHAEKDSEGPTYYVQNLAGLLKKLTAAADVTVRQFHVLIQEEFVVARLERLIAHPSGTNLMSNELLDMTMASLVPSKTVILLNPPPTPRRSPEGSPSGPSRATSAEPGSGVIPATGPPPPPLLLRRESSVGLPAGSPLLEPQEHPADGELEELEEEQAWPAAQMPGAAKGIFNFSPVDREGPALFGDPKTSAEAAPPSSSQEQNRSQTGKGAGKGCDPAKRKNKVSTLLDLGAERESMQDRHENNRRVQEHMRSILASQVYVLPGHSCSDAEVSRCMNKAVDDELNEWQVRSFRLATVVPQEAKNTAKERIRKAVFFLCKTTERLDDPGEWEDRLVQIDLVRKQWEDQEVGKTTMPESRLFQGSSNQLGSSTGSTDLEAGRKKFLERFAAAAPATATPCAPQEEEEADEMSFFLQGDGIPANTVVRAPRSSSKSDLEERAASALKWPKQSITVVVVWGTDRYQARLKVLRVPDEPAPPAPSKPTSLAAVTSSPRQASPVVTCVEAPPWVDKLRALMEGLAKLHEQPDERKEVCYGTLQQVLQNIVDNPTEAKFRTLPKWKGIQDKILKIPGGEEVLLALGFAEKTGEKGDVLVLPSEQVHSLQELQNVVVSHIRAWLWSLIAAWIHKLNTNTSYIYEDRETFAAVVLPQIKGILTRRLEPAFAPQVLSPEEARGLLKGLEQVAPSPQNVACALKAILSALGEDMLRSSSYAEDEPMMESPHPSAKQVGILRSGEVVRVLRSPAARPAWFQVVGCKEAFVAFAPRCRSVDGIEVEVFAPCEQKALSSGRAVPSLHPGEQLESSIAQQVEAYACLQERINAKHETYLTVSERYDAVRVEFAALKQQASGVRRGVNLVPTYIFEKTEQITLFNKLHGDLDDLEEEESTVLAELAALGSEMRDTMAQLLSLGVDPEGVVNLCADPRQAADRVPAALQLDRLQSVPHRDFANPREESCWLSSVFQCLWHSSVFHFSFEKHLRTRAPQAEEPNGVLEAFCRTWRLYSQGHGDISPTDLSTAFGVGWNDVSDALFMLQDAMEKSPDMILQNMSRGLIPHLPVQLILNEALSDELVGPRAAWRRVKEQSLTQAPLIAVMINPPTRDNMEPVTLSFGSKQIVASLYAPRHPDLEGLPDMGSSHRVVAMVLYMDWPRHYVVLCRLRTQPTKCRLFNDLPHLTWDAERDMFWENVPSFCARYGLLPRMVFYESSEAARKAVRKAAAEDQSPCAQM